jgi:hypothetical protein
MESGGRVSDLSTFVLLQQLLEDGTVSLPVWAAGGVGLRTAAACVLGGAAGVVLDSQLALMPESELPGDVMRVLRRLDGSETVMSPGQRGVRVVGRPARIAGPRDPEEDTTLLPIGQDGQLAATFAARWRDTASAVRGLRSAILETAADDVAGHALAPGAPLASALGVRIPVAQGPMTRVSDQAGFAAAVAGDGAMPFIALALADGERSRRMLLEVAAALGKHPWGVGVLGFVPEELRAAQLQVILDIKPAWAIVAGGRRASPRSCTCPRPGCCGSSSAPASAGSCSRAPSAAVTSARGPASRSGKRRSRSSRSSSIPGPPRRPRRFRSCSREGFTAGGPRPWSRPWPHR